MPPTFESGGGGGHIVWFPHTLQNRVVFCVVYNISIMINYDHFKYILIHGQTNTFLFACQKNYIPILHEPLDYGQ